MEVTKNILKLLDDEYLNSNSSKRIAHLTTYIQATYLMTTFLSENDVKSCLATMKKFNVTKDGYKKCFAPNNTSSRAQVEQLFEDLKDEILLHYTFSPR